MGDQSDPAEVRAVFSGELSKAQFKAALGELFKEGCIQPSKGEGGYCTRLVPVQDRPKARAWAAEKRRRNAEARGAPRPTPRPPAPPAGSAGVAAGVAAGLDGVAPEERPGGARAEEEFLCEEPGPGDFGFKSDK